MKLIYSGAHDVVEVPDAPAAGLIERGKPVDIPEAVAKRLLEQDTWEEAPKTPAKGKEGK